MASNSDFPEFEAKRDETASALEAALAELPAARAAVATLKGEALAAGRRFNAISTRVLYSQRPAGETAPALVRIVDAARKQRDEVDASLTRAKGSLSNIEWRVECLRADLDQLDRLISPAPAGGRLPEIAKRIIPGPAAVETIVFPADRSAPGEAA